MAGPWLQKDETHREELVIKMTLNWKQSFPHMETSQCRAAVEQLIEQIESCGFEIHKKSRAVM